MPSQLTIYTYLSLLLLLPLVHSGTSREGDISLWSDSECNSRGTTHHFSEPDPIGLNFTLWPDYCGVPGAAVHSYRVNANAICTSGAPARFKYYNSENCTPDPTDENPSPSLGPMRRRQMGGSGNNFADADGQDLTGRCLALTAFKSFAFICEEVDDDGFKTVLSPSPAPATSSSSSASLSSTPAASSDSSPDSNESSYTTSTSAVATMTSSDNVRVYTTSGPTVTVVASQSSNPSAASSSQPSAGAQSSGSSGGVSAGISIRYTISVLGAITLFLL